MGPIRVALVEDHHLVREGLRIAIASRHQKGMRAQILQTRSDRTGGRGLRRLRRGRRHIVHVAASSRTLRGDGGGTATHRQSGAERGHYTR